MLSDYQKGRNSVEVSSLFRSERCTFTNALIPELSSFELRTYPLLSKKISNKSKARKINNRFAEIENILKNIRDINESDNQIQ